MEQKQRLALSDRQLLVKHYLQALFPENIKDQLINQMGADFVVWLRFIVSELRNKQKWKLADFNVSETKKFDQELPIYYYMYDVIVTESFNEVKGRTGNFLLKSMANVKNRFDIYLEGNEMTIQLRVKASN
uniref:Addiction module toxin RelE n=1 Tax=Meloidogyne hapla TaxID=6305 RepID=A0A1I8B9S2_MELHA